MPNEPMTEERIAEISGRENAATPGPWTIRNEQLIEHGKQDIAIGVIAESFGDNNEDEATTTDECAANVKFIAHAREDIPALLNEVERLRAENEVLEKALEDLGFFVRTKLDYCPADFIGEGIDEDTDFPCHTEYDPDNASQKCYGDCWADAFRNQAENDIKKFEEWKLNQGMEV